MLNGPFGGHFRVWPAVFTRGDDPPEPPGGSLSCCGCSPLAFCSLLRFPCFYRRSGPGSRLRPGPLVSWLRGVPLPGRLRRPGAGSSLCHRPTPRRPRPRPPAPSCRGPDPSPATTPARAARAFPRGRRATSRRRVSPRESHVRSPRAEPRRLGCSVNLGPFALASWWVPAASGSRPAPQSHSQVPQRVAHCRGKVNFAPGYHRSKVPIAPARIGTACRGPPLTSHHGTPANHAYLHTVRRTGPVGSRGSAAALGHLAP